MNPSASHLVLIPAYNPGPRLLRTVTETLQVWSPVWVVIDGSTDDSDAALDALISDVGLDLVSNRETVISTDNVAPASHKVRPYHRNLRVIRRPANGGKGAAVLTGFEAALAAGFTHALVLDADGQHPTDHIGPFMVTSAADPAAMVLGKPVFGPEVPLERLYGRKLSVGLVHLECLGRDIADPLFGFRVYPIAPVRDILSSITSARRYDFDPEIAVRLFWRGIPVLNIPAPCRYIDKADGGISHFHYLRDNLRMIWLHTRLITRLIFREWPGIRRRRQTTA